MEWKRQLIALTLVSLFRVHDFGYTTILPDTKSQENVGHNCNNAPLSPTNGTDISKAIAQFCVSECIPENNCTAEASQEVLVLEDKLRLCQETLKISLDDCTCERSNRVCDYERGVFFPKTNDEFCSYAGVSSEMCTCELFPPICDFEPDNQHGKFDPRLIPLKFDVLENEQIAVAIITTIAMVIGVLGNSVVLLVHYRHQGSMPHGKTLIVLLALTDGASSVLNFIYTMHVFWTPTWPFGVPLCKVIYTGTMACSWMSIGFILIISIERFLGIVFSLRKHLRGRKMVYGSTAVNVVVALVAGVPMMLYTSVESDGICPTNLAPRNVAISYRWLLTVIFMIVPVCSVSILYLKIIHFLTLQLRTNISLAREDIQVKRIKDNRRTVKILMPILVAFVVCVLPVDIFDLYYTYWRHDMDKEVYRALVLVQNICYPLHACINPVIYTVIDRRFRDYLLDMLRCQKKRVSFAGVRTLSSGSASLA